MDHGRGDTGGSGAGATAERERAEAYFLPGVGAAEAEFAALDAHLAPRLRLRPAAYPGMGARGAVLSDMRATAGVVAADILGGPGRGPVALVGYSFGGSLALEVSRQLRAAGRDTAFLGVLDAPFGIGELRGLFEVLRLATVPRRAAKALVEAGARSETALRLMAAATAPAGDGGRGDDRGEPVRRALLTHLRTKALAGWTPEGCPAPGVLISTGILGEANLRRWLALCPNLAPVRVEAQHEALLDGDTAGRVAAALLEAAGDHGLLRD